MHGCLLEHREALHVRDRQRDAMDLGLDLDRFELDRTSAEVADRIRRDIASDKRGGVEGTPTFYVNGFRQSGPSIL